MENIYTFLISIVTVLGSAAAFRFYEKRAIQRERNEDFIRNDCRERIGKLENLLEKSSNEKDKLRDMILKLTEEVTTLRSEVNTLTKINNELSKTRKAIL